MMLSKANLSLSSSSSSSFSCASDLKTVSVSPFTNPCHLSLSAVSSVSLHHGLLHLRVNHQTHAKICIKSKRSELRVKCATNEPPKIMISGAPASGEGTQCELILQQLGVVHISTGDLLRAEVAAGTEIGNKAQENMVTGRLVPDEIVTAFFWQRATLLPSGVDLSLFSVLIKPVGRQELYVQVYSLQSKPKSEYSRRSKRKTHRESYDMVCETPMSGAMKLVFPSECNVPFGTILLRDALQQEDNGALPNPNGGTRHLRHIFYRLGFNDKDIVALSGAHTLGRAHQDRSGFDGPFTYEPLKF